MSDRLDETRRFLDLHRPGDPLRMPNPWDAGFAKLLASLGFEALATTSSGHAGTLGRLDYGVTRDEALAHAARIVQAVDVPVSADLENGFADDPAGVAATVRGAVEAGLAGCSIEDFSGRRDAPIYDRGLAVERVAAAAEVSRADGTRIALTARCENHLHGAGDLDDTIARLAAYAEAGADVVYAPGVTDLADVERIVGGAGAPVNVLLLPGSPSVDELATAGVARVSVGGSFHLVALQAVAEAGRELLDRGTHGYWGQAIEGMKARNAAFDG
jgi:2-methylisocitrate lyase-like PEP mutase family enzyme